MHYVKDTVAVPVFVGSVLLVAVTVKVSTVIPAFTVSKPFASIEAFGSVVTDHVTSGEIIPVPSTVAAN